MDILQPDGNAFPAEPQGDPAERAVGLPEGVPDPSGPPQPVGPGQAGMSPWKPLGCLALAGVAVGAVISFLSAPPCMGATRSARLRWEDRNRQVDQAAKECAQPAADGTGEGRAAGARP
jgi:hypothetical protein